MRTRWETGIQRNSAILERKRSFRSKKGRFAPNVWTDWKDGVTVRKTKEGGMANGL